MFKPHLRVWKAGSGFHGFAKDVVCDHDPFQMCHYTTMTILAKQNTGPDDRGRD
jgi:hypothetical protein